jgi:hypothetical protein
MMASTTSVFLVWNNYCLLPHPPAAAAPPPCQLFPFYVFLEQFRTTES